MNIDVLIDELETWENKLPLNDRQLYKNQINAIRKALELERENQFKQYVLGNNWNVSS